jgi:hypothetical protein
MAGCPAGMSGSRRAPVSEISANGLSAQQVDAQAMVKDDGKSRNGYVILYRAEKISIANVIRKTKANETQGQPGILTTAIAD